MLLKGNRPSSIHQYFNMPPRLSLQTSIFGGVFFVSKSLLGIVRQKKLEMFKTFSRKRRGHVGILIYRTRPIDYYKLLTSKIFLVIWRSNERWVQCSLPDRPKPQGGSASPSDKGKPGRGGTSIRSQPANFAGESNPASPTVEN